MIATLDIVSFRCGGWRVGVDARQVSASRAMPLDTEDIPELAPLLGLRGLPLGTPATQMLVVKSDAGDREFRVAGPVELRALSTESIYPLPALLSARSTVTGLRALALEEGAITLLVDLSALASSAPTEAS